MLHRSNLNRFQSVFLSTPGPKIGRAPNLQWKAAFEAAVGGAAHILLDKRCAEQND
jgi:hypothetical protein